MFNLNPNAPAQRPLGDCMGVVSPPIKAYFSAKAPWRHNNYKRTKEMHITKKIRHETAPYCVRELEAWNRLHSTSFFKEHRVHFTNWIRDTKSAAGISKHVGVGTHVEQARQSAISGDGSERDRRCKERERRGWRQPGAGLEVGLSPGAAEPRTRGIEEVRPGELSTLVRKSGGGGRSSQGARAQRPSTAALQPRRGGAHPPAYPLNRTSYPATPFAPTHRPP